MDTRAPQFTFNAIQFNRLFPFYILIDNKLKIKGLGSSISKLCHAKVGDHFNHKFILKRPDEVVNSIDELKRACNQLAIIQPNNQPSFVLRGQFEYSEQAEEALFVGTPWFGSMDQVREHKLTLHDFAFHDPMIDLLHVLKTQEITTEEIKHLLKTVNDQKNVIKESELNYRSIVEKATDIIYKVDYQGNFRFVNKVAERITGYSREELLHMNYSQLIRDDYKEKAAQLYFNQFENRIPTTYFEFPIHSKDGKEIWIGQSVQLHLNESSEIELTALAIDISVRKNAEMNLLLQEEKYRNIIANMNLGLLEVDLDDKIQFANQSFCQLSGYSLDELIGQTASKLFMSDEGRELLNRKNKKRTEGISDMYSLPVRNKSGEQRWWVISGAPRYNDNGVLVGSVGIHLDVTEQKHLEEELKVAKLKAEDSSKAKESFLATMSHEIRTPLNAIVGITDLMQLSQSARNDQNLEILSFSAKNLLALISDILDLSKIDAGKVEFNNTPIDLKGLMCAIYQTFKPSCEEKKVELILSIHEDTPHFIVGDELRLSQILNNLISNAVKFTSKGFVKIEISPSFSEDNKVDLLFKITDSGIGIPKAKQQSVFDAFEQADKKVVRQFGGTGLGLNITRKLIEMHGSEIKLVSKPGKGSTFSFSIKYSIATQVSSKADAQTNDNEEILSGGQSINVLLVEDNLANQKVAVSYFKHWGLKYTIANNGAEALEFLKSTQFDIALVDLFMPVLDGFETIQRIRKMRKLKKFPLIALTASAETSLMQKALADGANKCLTKPFNAKELKSTIFELVTQKEMETGLEVISKKPISSFRWINLQTISDASLGSSEFIGELLEMLIREIPILMAESEHLLKINELDLFSKVVHKMKSSMLTLGMEKIRKDLVFMEENGRAGKNKSEIESTFRKVSTYWNNARVEAESALQYHLKKSA